MEQTNSKPLKTAIYIRVSTEEQAKEGYSIDAQKFKLIQYCQFKEWEIVGVYIDEGISGKTLKDRPEVLRMLNDIKTGAINNIVIYKLDRLARKVKDMMEIVDLVEKYQVGLHSLSENLDTSTPNGQMLLAIMAAIAENERKVITERMTLGKEQKARSGKYNPGRRPFGYIYNVETKKLEIVEHEAEIVKEMFKTITEGKGYAYLSRVLNERNVACVNNGIWSRQSVKLIVQNPIYAGLIRYRKNGKVLFISDSINIEPIINKGTFELAQRILSARSNGGRVRKNSSDNFIFGDVLFCSRCGWKFVNHQTVRITDSGEKKIIYSYKCAKNKSEYGANRCSQQQIINYKVENAFMEYLKHITVEAIDTGTETANTNEIKRRISQLKSELLKIDTRKKNLQLKYIDGKINDDEYQELLKTILGDSKSINEQIISSENEIKYIEQQQLSVRQIEDLKQLTKRIINLWPNMTNSEKRNFITAHFKKIELDGQTIKKIWF